jgi:carboxymethylenebutenolidase
MQNYLLHEFVEDYKDGYLTRRDLLRLVVPIVGSVAAASAVLLSLGCGDDDEDAPTATSGAAGASPTTAATSTSAASPTAAASPTSAASPTAAASPTTAASPSVSPTTGTTGSPSASPVAQSPDSVPEDDPDVAAEDISFEGNGTTLLAYQAQPSAGDGPFALILICHENRGLTAHIRDVARRYAKQGYLACALDLLSREGGTSAIPDPTVIPGTLSNTDTQQHADDFQAAVDFYLTQPDLADAERIGMTGFCFGGGVTWYAVTQIAELKAAVPYYGPPPPLELVPNIAAAVLGVYSDDPNDFANEGRDELVAALEEAGIEHQITIYPGTQHAFHNDTGQRYNPEQAQAAWQDTLDWFATHLGGS